MTRTRWIILGVVVLAIAAYFGWRALNPAEVVEPYRTAKVERADLAETITANGVLNPVRVVNVGTQVSGTVNKLYADYNDRVTAGQVLLELDPRVFAARVQASEAQAAQVRANAALSAANARRSEQLFKQDYISRQDYETAVAAQRAGAAQLASAQAQIAQDRTNLGYSVIRSPVSGVVISRAVDLGQTVAASFNTPVLFTIARDLNAMQIEAAVAEADVAKVKTGQAVDFTVDAYGSRQFKGFVRQIRLNPATQQNVVTYTVIVDVANPDGALLPGMTANASFLVSDKPNALVIPNAALSFKPEGYRAPRRAGAAAGGRRGARDPDRVTVFKLVEGQPQAVRIRVGASDSDNTEIVSGPLKAGDTVITGANKPEAAGGFGPPGTGGNQQRRRGRDSGGGGGEDG